MKTPATKIKRLDPDNIPVRLYRQVSELLTQLEEGENITLRERVQALLAIGRLVQLFDKRGDNNEHAGSTVRKYESAFTTDGTRQRKANARPEEPEPDDWFESAEIDDGTKYDPGA